MELISDNGVSRVWRQDGWVYKRQPKHLHQNEIYALRAMYSSGYVPYAEEVDPLSTCRMEDLGGSKPVTDAAAFMAHLPLVLEAMRKAGLRHGDLTEYAVIVRENKPHIVDWAESRLWDDPRPDKRPGGDRRWLTKTMLSLCP